MAIRRHPEGLHVVAIPYPAQGHISPMLEICRCLLPFGFTFTFVNTHHIHRRLKGSLNAVFDGHGLDSGNPIDMVYVEGGIPPEEHARLSTLQGAFKAAQEMKESVDLLISGLVEQRKVAFLLTDIFLSWGSEMAMKFALPWACFCPVSAACLAAFAHFTDLAEQGKQVELPDNGEADLFVVEDIPGLPATYLGDVPKVWDDAGNVNLQLVKMFHSPRKARFVLFNSFEELEGAALQALSERQYNTLTIGPLVPHRYFSGDGGTRVEGEAGSGEARTMRPSLFEEDRTCMEWLDKHPQASVLFISFGSISLRSAEQLEELAYGVEAAGCPYLWVQKPDVSDGPPGERPAGGAQQRGKGLIAPWVPQLDVLAHPAVGGFLTHCGWNSVVEAVSMGVPMLCWADMGERMCNQRFVSRVWKCGLDVVPDGRRYKQHIDEADLLRRDEIERSIRCLMVEDGGASCRARAARLREAAIVALQDASACNFNTFARDILVQPGLDNSL